MSVSMRKEKQMHTVDEVKECCDELEVSPSKRSASSPVYGKGKTPTQPQRGHGSKTHAGKRGTKETPERLSPAHAKRGH